MIFNPEAFISHFYNDAIANAKRVIEGRSEDYLTSVEIDDLVEYISDKACLPQIIEDTNKEVTWEKSHYMGQDPYWPEREVKIPIVRIYFPIIPSERLDPVLRLLPSTFTTDDKELLLEGDNIVVQANPQNIEREIEDVRQLIKRKNDTIIQENERLRREMRTYLEAKLERISKENAQIEEAIKRLPIKLIRKEDAKEPIVDLKTKKHIKVLRKPEPKKRGRETLFLGREKVISVIDLLKSSGYSFERTPKVFSNLQEEDLRDILLSHLNSVFEGEATGETFSKKGKTDIFLKIDKGNILVVECKIWGGQKLYKSTIDQLFNYLTWRDNYGIIVSFSRNLGFTDVIERARQSAIEHSTYHGELKIIEDNHFQTLHTFPEDEIKRVEIHHLIFNIYL